MYDSEQESVEEIFGIEINTIKRLRLKSLKFQLMSTKIFLTESRYCDLKSCATLDFC